MRANDGMVAGRKALTFPASWSLESKGNRQASISSVVEALGRYYAPFYRPFSQAFGDLQPGDSFIRVRAFLPDASWEAFGRAPVAQLDRASDYESEGWEFESLRARQSPYRRSPANTGLFVVLSLFDG